MNYKYFNFSVILIILTLMDIITTRYALINYSTLREGNTIMAMVTGSWVLFLIVKSIGVLFIINIYKRIQVQSNIAAKIGQTLIIVMMIFVVSNNLVVIGSAIDTTIANVSCINSGFDTNPATAPLIYTDNGISNSGVYSSAYSAGYVAPANQRIYNGSNILCSISDYTSQIGTTGQYRIFGISESGNVFYTDATLNNFGNGFYDPGSNPTSSLYKIGALSASTTNRKIGEDSSGNIYIADGVQIYQFQKSNNYVPIVYYTLISGIDYTPGAPLGITTDILDIQFDGNDNMHILVGTSGTSGAGVTSYGYLTDSIISNGIHTNLSSLESTSGVQQVSGYKQGGLNLDSINPTSNFSYAYYSLLGAKGLKHNSSTGKTTISALTGLNSVTDIVHYSNQIFVASQADNLVRSYGVSYLGYTPTITGTAVLSYTTHTVRSIYDTYYNNSNIIIAYDISYTIPKSITSTTIYTSNSQRILLLDPNMLPISEYSIPKSCTSDYGLYWIGFDLRTGTSYNCSMQGTVSFSQINGSTGSYGVQLRENPSQAILDSDSFQVLNISGTTIVGIPSIDVNTGNNSISVSIFDNYVTLLGFGLSDVSKLLFAVVVATLFGAFALFTSKRGDVAALVMFAPYIVFTYINYIPKWIFIVVIIMLAIISKIFR